MEWRSGLLGFVKKLPDFLGIGGIIIFVVGQAAAGRQGVGGDGSVITDRADGAVAGGDIEAALVAPRGTNVKSGF